MSKYLTKKGHKAHMGGRSIAPMQGRQGPMPSMGAQQGKHESLGNTKSTGGSKPTGIAHSKVMTAPANMKVGKYL